jgi:hypothetical protein
VTAGIDDVRERPDAYEPNVDQRLDAFDEERYDAGVFSVKHGNVARSRRRPEVHGADIVQRSET